MGKGAWWRDEGAELRLQAVPPDEVELDLPQWNADLVLLVLRPDGRVAHVFVVEVQLRKDWRKRYSWPVYASCLRARHRCPCDLVVITFEENVARWAARPIRLGEGSSLRPLVIGPETIPLVIDPKEGRRDPELTLLSVLAHGRRRDSMGAAETGSAEAASPEGPDARAGAEEVGAASIDAEDVDVDVAHAEAAEAGATTGAEVASMETALGLAALAGLEGVDPTRVVIYLDLVSGALSRAALQTLEAEMQSAKTKEDYPNARRFVRRLFKVDVVEIEREGERKGMAEGERKGLSQAVLRVLAARGLRVTKAQKSQIAACEDLSLLETWLDRAATVSSAKELFH